jgi:hypothetical protein
VYDIKDRAGKHGQQFRVIEYILQEETSAAPKIYRLITNIVDRKQAPADELAAL